MEIIGLLASILIGISLGLVGSGGSILTVPVLIYLFGTDAVAATSYSLFIVGVTAAAGSIAYFKRLSFSEFHPLQPFILPVHL
jgi:uncharacterized protein